MVAYTFEFNLNGLAMVPYQLPCIVFMHCPLSKLSNELVVLYFTVKNSLATKRLILQSVLIDSHLPFHRYWSAIFLTNDNYIYLESACHGKKWWPENYCTPKHHQDVAI